MALFFHNLLDTTQTIQGVIFMKDYIEERAVEIAYYIIEPKVTNRKYKVYNFVENY